MLFILPNLPVYPPALKIFFAFVLLGLSTAHVFCSCVCQLDITRRYIAAGLFVFSDDDVNKMMMTSGRSGTQYCLYLA